MANPSQSSPSKAHPHGRTVISVLIPGDLLARLQHQAHLTGEPITALGSRLLEEAVQAILLE